MLWYVARRESSSLWSLLLLLRTLSYPLLASFSSARRLTGTKSVYIARTQRNLRKLLEKHWILSLLDLVKKLRAKIISIFVSTYQNRRWNFTRALLQQLKQTQVTSEVHHQITIYDTSHVIAKTSNLTNQQWRLTHDHIRAWDGPYSVPYACVDGDPENALCPDRIWCHVW